MQPLCSEERGGRAIAQRPLAGCDANVSSCCHSLDSFVVKMAAGERGNGIQRRCLSLTFILFISRARTSDVQKENAARCL